MKRILFIDRDGVVLVEPESDFQINSTIKTSFVPGSITALARIAEELDYYKVMVTNQDGLGTASYPQSDFLPYNELVRSKSGLFIKCFNNSVPGFRVGWLSDANVVSTTNSSNKKPSPFNVRSINS